VRLDKDLSAHVLADSMEQVAQRGAERPWSGSAVSGERFAVVSFNHTHNHPPTTKRPTT